MLMTGQPTAGPYLFVRSKGRVERMSTDSESGAKVGASIWT